MNVAGSWAIDIIGPIVLLIMLIGLAIRRPSAPGRRGTDQTKSAAQALYHKKDQRRRDGIDQF